MVVTSKDNQWVKEWRTLSSDTKRRRESGKFVIEGTRLCGDALRSGVRCETVLYTADARSRYVDVVESLIGQSDNAVEIAPSLARAMGDTTNPQGVFCIVNALDNSYNLSKIDTMGFYGALEDIQDPGNLGTIIRTAEAMGLSGLLLSDGCCDVYNPKVLRGSMGGVFRLPLWQVGNMTDAVAALNQKGLVTCACVVDADAEAVHTAGMGRGCVAVIGNEGNGLRRETVAACSKRVTIPMSGRAESLNASMAAGIVLWEMTRPNNNA